MVCLHCGRWAKTGKVLKPKARNWHRPWAWNLCNTVKWWENHKPRAHQKIWSQAWISSEETSQESQRQPQQEKSEWKNCNPLFQAEKFKAWLSPQTLAQVGKFIFPYRIGGFGMPRNGRTAIWQANSRCCLGKLCRYASIQGWECWFRSHICKPKKYYKNMLHLRKPATNAIKWKKLLLHGMRQFHG